MKNITIGTGLDPVSYIGVSTPEADIPVGVGVSVGVNGVGVGWSKDIAEVEINIRSAD
jgi:hypothetical protein